MKILKGPHRQWAMGQCFYCGRETYRTTIVPQPAWAYTRDHLIPFRLRTERYNLLSHWLTTVTCCFECNNKKSGLSAQDFIQKFLTIKQRKRIPWKRIASIYRMNAQ